MTTEIALKDGGAAVVDDEDAPQVAGHKWYVNGRGYAVRWQRDHGKAKLVMMHRCVTRAPKGKTVHHVNGNKLDNRRDNLAVLDPAEHQRVHDRE